MLLSLVIAFLQLVGSLATSDIFVDRAASVRLNCTVEGDLTVLIWDRIHSGGTEHNILSQGSRLLAGASKYRLIPENSVYNLEVLNVQPTDDGFYRCYDFGNDARRQEYNLQTIVRPTQSSVQIRGDGSGMDEGSAGNLTCTVTGVKPAPVLRWRRFGSQSSLAQKEASQALLQKGTSTYTSSLNIDLTITRSLIGAVLVCEVELQAISEAFYYNHTLNINSFPSVPIVTLNELNTIEGFTYTATCTTNQGKPAPNVTWYLGSDSNPQNATLSATTLNAQANDGTYDVTSTLTHTSSKLHNGWKLSCSVINEPLQRAGWPSKSSFQALDIWFRPVIAQINSTMVVQENSAVVLPCEVSSNPVAEIAWFHMMKPFNVTSGDVLGGTKEQPSLTIPIITYEMEGRWQCQARNDVGGASGTLLELDIKHAPVFNLGPDFPLTTVRERQDVTLSCRVKADPMPLDHQYWYDRSGNRVKENTTLVKLSNNNETLTLLNVNRSQSGDYYCSARNSLGSRTSLPITLQVQYAPEYVNIMPSSPSYNKGDMLPGLTCSSNGQPIPQYRWFKNDIQIELNNSVLHFNSTAQADHRANYMCRSENYLGAITKHVFLDVKYPPECLPGMQMKYGAKIGKTIKVACYLRASPRTNPTVSISHHGTSRSFSAILNEGNDVEFHASLQLTVNSDSDYGDISCNGSTSLGWLRQPCNIQVVPSSPPDAPTSCHVSNVTTTSFVTSCLPGFDGGSDVTFTLQLVAEEQYKDYTSSPSASIVIENLVEGSCLRMRTCASNYEFSDERLCSSEYNVTLSGHSNLVSTTCDSSIQPGFQKSGAENILLPSSVTLVLMVLIWNLKIII